MQSAAGDSGLFSQCPSGGRVQRIAIADEPARQRRFATVGQAAALDRQNMESPITHREDHQLHGYSVGELSCSWPYPIKGLVDSK